MCIYQIETGSWQILKSKASSVRYQVFVQEQHVPISIEMDELDASSQHVVIEDQEGTAIGTARLLPNGHIGRMAVLSHHRGQGVGGLLLKTLLAMALEQGRKTVFLSAQLHARAFYTRYDFKAYGEVYQDANIDHQMMRCELSD